MKSLVFTGGFHPEMPFHELEALGFEEEERDGRILIGRTDSWKRLKRLGYSHLTLRYLGDFEPGENLPFDPEKWIEGEFAARFKRVEFAERFREIRKDILEKLDSYIEEVNFNDPDTEMYFFFKGEKIYAGILLYEFEASDFFKRKPGLRPFSKPISLPPRESRCWVNLSQVSEGGKLLDPFCGTGGILMEAGLIGCDLYGSDFDSEMVSGTKMNLDYYGLEGEIRRCDARKLNRCWNEKFDAIVTDPSYGRASKTVEDGVKETYLNALPELEKVLKEGKRCVIGAQKAMDFEEILKQSGAGFEVVKKFEEKVHGSLSREIFVLKKG